MIGTPVLLGTGTNNEEDVSVEMTTGVAVAAGEHVIVAAGASGVHNLSDLFVSGGGLTWHRDAYAEGGAPEVLGGHVAGVFSARAPAGLAQGTTLTATWTAYGEGAARISTIAAVKVSGLAELNWLDQNTANIHTAADPEVGDTDWDTGTTAERTASEEISIGGIAGRAWSGNGIGATSTPDAGPTEICDFATWYEEMGACSETMLYQKHSSTGTSRMTGHWSENLQQTIGCIATYIGAAAASRLAMMV